MLINLTNHPSSKWSTAQLNASAKYGNIVDIEFPQIDANASEEDIELLAKEYLNKILAIDNNATVLCQGEMCFVFNLVNLLIDKGITVISATSQRVSKDIVEDNQIKKLSIFEFARYRKYTK